MYSQKQKRKSLSLSIAHKVELLQKLDLGVSVRHLIEDHGVETTTIYHLNKQKHKLLKFYSDQKLMENRKTLHSVKNKDLDCVLLEWVWQGRIECMPLTGLIVMKQATKYHEELNIEGECKYWEGWRHKFKKHHGIKYLKICGEKAADYDAAERYIDEFGKMVSDENLSPDQIYNADETALHWPSTLPLSHPIPCIVLIYKTLRYTLNIFHSEIWKMYGPKVFG